MVTKHHNGKVKTYRSLRYLERILWKTEHVKAYGNEDGTWTAHFHYDGGMVLAVTFTTGEALWDFTHRRTLNGVLLVYPGRNLAFTIVDKNRGNYPWKMP